MALPPQFMKNFKKKEAEGKAEPGDSKKEDAAEIHKTAKHNAVKKLANKHKHKKD